MKDMNFFSPFLEKKSTKGLKINYTIIAAVVAGILLLSPIVLFGYQMLLSQQIASEEKLLNAPENVEIVSRIETKKEHLTVAQQSVTELQKKDTLLASSEVTSEKSLQVIIDTLPKQVKLDSLMIMGSEIGVQGTAVDRPAIAELAYNIRKSGLAEGLVLPTITQNVAGGFDFSLNFKLKAVGAQ